MSHTRPIVVALPLDHETDDILNSASELSRRLGAPIIPVHALGWRPETESGRVSRTASELDEVETHLAPLRDIGVELYEPVVERDAPDELVFSDWPVLLNGALYGLVAILVIVGDKQGLLPPLLLDGS